MDITGDNVGSLLTTSLANKRQAIAISAKSKLVQAMRARLRKGGHQSRYGIRKYTVEPVFGHIKQARGFRQFLLRGIDKVKGEWAMICTAHNLAKLTT